MPRACSPQRAPPRAKDPCRAAPPRASCRAQLLSFFPAVSQSARCTSQARLLKTQLCSTKAASRYVARPARLGSVCGCARLHRAAARAPRLAALPQQHVVSARARTRVVAPAHAAHTHERLLVALKSPHFHSFCVFFFFPFLGARTRSTDPVRRAAPPRAGLHFAKCSFPGKAAPAAPARAAERQSEVVPRQSGPLPGC